RHSMFSRGWSSDVCSSDLTDYALVREAVADVSQLALLGVLLDGVEELVLGDLSRGIVSYGSPPNDRRHGSAVKKKKKRKKRKKKERKRKGKEKKETEEITR